MKALPPGSTIGVIGGGHWQQRTRIRGVRQKITIAVRRRGGAAGAQLGHHAVQRKGVVVVALDQGALGVEHQRARSPR